MLKNLVALCAVAAGAAFAQQPFEKYVVFLKHRQELVEELRARFHEVSDPQSPKYGQHLTHEETMHYQQPHAEHIDAVYQHLHEIGAIHVAHSTAGDKIEVMMPAHLQPSEKFPDQIMKYIDMVVGGEDSMRATKKPLPRKTRRQPRDITLNATASSDPADCFKQKATPACIKTAYGLSGSASASNNSQAVIVNEMYKQSDLAKFAQVNDLNTPADVTNVGDNSGPAGLESSLDLQFIQVGGNGNIPTTWVYLDGHSKNPFSNWLVWASNTSQVPYVHSLSVGESESEFESDNGVEATVRINNEIMALGARGVSVIFASGDSGYSVNQKFGSSSPYVTSIGGVWNGDLGYDDLEVDPITTGGFSNLDIHPIQPWQVDAVAAWMKTKGDRPSRFNSTRRCCPDLSLYDDGYPVIQGGGETVAGGTSTAAPVLAGMIAMINDALLAKKKPTLGFLNYFLYQNQAAFEDVTRGGNNGFDATEGYDPASGLGTFNVNTFNTLMSKALSQHEE